MKSKYLLPVACVCVGSAYFCSPSVSQTLGDPKNNADAVFSQLARRIRIVSPFVTIGLPTKAIKGNEKSLIKQIADAGHLIATPVYTADGKFIVFHEEYSSPLGKIVNYVPQQGSLNGEQVYSALSFMDALTSQELAELSKGLLDIRTLSPAAQVQLSQFTSYLSSRNHSYFPEQSELEITSVAINRPNADRTLVSLRIIPMLKIKAGSTLSSSLIPWQHVVFGDAYLSKTGSFLRSAGYQGFLDPNVKRLQPLSPVFLSEYLKEKTEVDLQRNGWFNASEMLRAVGTSAYSVVIDRDVAERKIWLASGKYSRGTLRQLVLRALGLSVRLFRDGKETTVFVGQAQPSLQQQSVMESRNITRATSTLLPLYKNDLQLLLARSKVPLRYNELWRPSRSFKQFSTEQQNFLATRWIETNQNLLTAQSEGNGALIKIKTEDAVAKLSTSTVEIVPSLLFTIGVYKPSATDSTLLECIKEEQILM